MAPLVVGACSSDDDSASDTEEESSTTTTADETTSTTPSGGPVNAAVTVDTNEFSFTPASVTVAVGDAVTWENTGSAQHTVTPDVEAGAPEPWVSQRIAPEETFVVTLSEPGTYAYFCSIHPDRMLGTVTVEPAG
jgi:plastocyanin